MSAFWILLIVLICNFLEKIVLSIFSYAYSYLCIFFGEVSDQIFCPFLNWIVFLLLVLRFLLCIYRLSKYPLSDMCLPKIFSQSVAFLFIPLTGSIAEQMFLILMKYSLSFFLSCVMYLVLYLKTHHQITLPRFSHVYSTSFPVLYFTFTLLFILRYILCNGARSVFRWIFPPKETCSCSGTIH